MAKTVPLHGGGAVFLAIFYILWYTNTVHKSVWRNWQTQQT